MKITTIYDRPQETEEIHCNEAEIEFDSNEIVEIIIEGDVECKFDDGDSIWKVKPKTGFVKLKIKNK
jgi:hypothetical protein